MRKYKYDENYFRSIDTNNKAYFLGLWYSDGCVLYSEKRKGISIGLQARDRELIDAFLKEIESPHKIVFTPKRSETFQDKYSIQISSSVLSRDLIKLGCIPRKSNILTFPTIEQLPEKFQADFIRGYFDGDGTINLSRKGSITYIPQYRFAFCGTESMCEGIREVLNIQLRLRKTKIYHKTGGYGTCCELVYGGNKNVSNFYNYIYNNAEIFLNRKKEKMELCINTIPIVHIHQRNNLGQYIT